MSAAGLPEWPLPSAFNLPRDYERARAEAAMAWIKILADALTDCAKAGYVAGEYMNKRAYPSHLDQMRTALLKAGHLLAAVKEIPK